MRKLVSGARTQSWLLASFVLAVFMLAGPLVAPAGAADFYAQAWIYELVDGPPVEIMRDVKTGPADGDPIVASVYYTGPGTAQVGSPSAAANAAQSSDGVSAISANVVELPGAILSQASTSLVENITNGSGVPQSYWLDFTISTPFGMAMYDALGKFEGMGASYFASIYAGASELWGSTGQLSASGLIVTGADLGLVQEMTDPTTVLYSLPAPYSGRVDLGILNPGESLAISYGLAGWALSTGIEPVEGVGISSNGPLSGAALMIGDPFSLTSVPGLWGTVGSAPAGAVIPEPSTYALFGIGILGLLAWRRRRQAV